MVNTNSDPLATSPGVSHHCAPGAVLVDMTTSEPALATEIYQAARARGVAALDAPVSGGDLGARGASLAIMVGGENLVTHLGVLTGTRSAHEADILPPCFWSG